MKYYCLKIYTKHEASVFKCEVNQRTLDYLLGPWQDEGKAYRHDDLESSSGFYIYKEEITSFSWEEIFKECNIGLHLFKD